MKVVPLGEYVVVKRIEPPDATAGGILLPDRGREPSQQGRVLSVGDGRRLPDGGRARPQVRDGDRIVFAAYAGAPLQVDGDDLLILREDEILAVIE